MIKSVDSEDDYETRRIHKGSLVMAPREVKKFQVWGAITLGLSAFLGFLVGRRYPR